METGYLPNRLTYDCSGLCGAALGYQIDNEILLLFEPTWEDQKQIINNYESTGWWGYEVAWNNENNSDIERRYGFTTLRQTIVLFMACMAGEKF